jgi:hypothetical protein
MRNAWRQAEYRAPEKGRKACTFKLKAEVKKALASLAKKNDANETDMLSMLIFDGENVHARLRDRLDRLTEQAKKHRQGNKTAMDLLEFTAAMLCLTEILLHDALPTVTVTPDQKNRIDNLRKKIWGEIKTDIAESAGKISESTSIFSGRVSRSMRETNRVSNLVLRKTQENTNTAARARFTDLQPVTYSKLRRQRSSEPMSGSAAMLPNHSVTDGLEIVLNEKSLDYKTGTPPPQRQRLQQERSIWLLSKTELGPHT